MGKVEVLRLRPSQVSAHGRVLMILNRAAQADLRLAETRRVDHRALQPVALHPAAEQWVSADGRAVTTAHLVVDNPAEAAAAGSNQ